MRKTVLQVALRSLMTAGVIFALSSCGNSSNDQGVSFTFLGFFQFEEDEEIECEDFPTGLSATAINLSGDGSLVSGSVVAAIGAQNNLTDQFVRVNRMDLEFDIPGAFAQPPSSSTPVSLFLGPSVPEDQGDDEGFDSSLPPGFSEEGICQRSFSEVIVIPASVRTWIAFNQGSLPETPFTMFVKVTLTGVSSAGNTFVSNSEFLPVEVNTDIIF